MVKPESGDDWIYVNRCKPHPETMRPELGENLCYNGHSGAMKRLIPAFSSIQTSERLTLDSLVFALIKSGRPRTFLKAVLRPDHALILSEPIIEEPSRATEDEKIKRYADDEAVAAYLRVLLSKAVFVRPRSRVRVFNNPDDNVLSTAKEGDADFIVTGDKHMLELKEFKGIKIVTVEKALSIVGRKR